ncbi:hypothetical protein P692DRAFT_201806601 [Suillus brevipes Sb2]|nr:hypothetical protein P692DRAFT_201806601 [Suillus brevipes Sb2]
MPPRQRGRGRRGQSRPQVVVVPTAAEPLPTADPIPTIAAPAIAITPAAPAIAITHAIPTITPTIPAITPAIPAIPAIDSAIAPVPTAMLASANATTLHITHRLPTTNVSTHPVPTRTTDEGEYFDLDVSDHEDEDGAAPSPLQATTDTAQTDPYATGGRGKRTKAAQDSAHFFRDDTINKCRVCKLCEFHQGAS